MLVRNANRVDPDQKQSELGLLYLFRPFGQTLWCICSDNEIASNEHQNKCFHRLKKIINIFAENRYDINIIDILESNSRDIMNILILILFCLIFRLLYFTMVN